MCIRDRDTAFLGFGELDRFGNVNVSKLGGLTVGPGGFMDIAQNARKVVFCGTFDAKGAEMDAVDGSLVIKRHGAVRKLVSQVEQITYSGAQAMKLGHEATVITERAVFELRPEGLVLTEFAPGIDLQADILDRMGYAPLISPDLRRMDADLFRR